MKSTYLKSSPHIFGKFLDLWLWFINNKVSCKHFQGGIYYLKQLKSCGWVMVTHIRFKNKPPIIPFEVKAVFCIDKGHTQWCVSVMQTFGRLEKGFNLEASVGAITRQCFKNKNPFKIHILTKKKKKGILGRAKNVEKLKKNIDIPLKSYCSWGIYRQKSKQKKEPGPIST